MRDKLFAGIGDPAEVKSWMVKIERVFDIMDCSDNQKLCLATFLVEVCAYDWWKSVHSKYVHPSMIT